MIDTHIIPARCDACTHETVCGLKDKLNNIKNKLNSEWQAQKDFNFYFCGIGCKHFCQKVLTRGMEENHER